MLDLTPKRMTVLKIKEKDSNWSLQSVLHLCDIGIARVLAFPEIC